MKRIQTLLLLPLLLIFLQSCGGGDDSKTTQDASKNEASAVMDEEMSDDDEMASADKAICLWGKAGLRDGAGRGKDLKYLATITFGEVVKLTGEAEEIEKRNYLEMELSDGKSGWAYDYLFAVGGERAVAFSSIDIFKRPDITTITSKKLERGQIFAVVPSDEEGWMEVYGKEKKIEGWARLTEDAYSTDEVDVALAIKMDQIGDLKSTSEKKKELESLAGSSMFSSSPLFSMVEDQMLDMDKARDLPANQLMIQASTLNVRSEPQKPAEGEEDNIVFKVSEGDVCNILEKSNDKVQIRDMNDYWYKIELNGQVGWVYGHYTSKAL
ncbi:MAG: SH3 domain-containing protein [Bacteroidota bacterium]